MVFRQVGQTLEFFSNGRAIPARIVSLRRLDPIEEQRGGLGLPLHRFCRAERFL